jgi:hypothetical protein
MSKKSPKNDGVALANKLASLPQSSKWMLQNPFLHQLNDEQLAEWEIVKDDYEKGKFQHVSITQLKKYILDYFSMRPMSFDKFKAELEGKGRAKS